MLMASMQGDYTSRREVNNQGGRLDDGTRQILARFMQRATNYKTNETIYEQII
jgi:hypothetical protein